MSRAGGNPETFCAEQEHLNTVAVWLGSIDSKSSNVKTERLNLDYSRR